MTKRAEREEPSEYRLPLDPDNRVALEVLRSKTNIPVGTLANNILRMCFAGGIEVRTIEEQPKIKVSENVEMYASARIRQAFRL